MKYIRIFYLKIFSFLVIKFSVYLNRRVFVMLIAEVDEAEQQCPIALRCRGVRSYRVMGYNI